MRKIIAVAIFVSALALPACGMVKPVEPQTSPGTQQTLPGTSPITNETTSPATTSPATAAPTTSGSHVTAPATDVPVTLPITAEPTTVPKKTDGMKTILLDPGHGFADGGTSSSFLVGKTEKDVNFACTLAVKAALELRGYNVILTHDGNSYPSDYEIEEKCKLYGLSYNPEHSQWVPTGNVYSAYERAIYATVADAEYGVDLFISLHCDAYTPDASISGTGIYYCTENPYSADTRRAVILLENSLRSVFPGRRIRTEGFSWDDGYAVTKYPTSPSILVEMGYITNKNDVDNLTDAEWQAVFANALADAVSAFIG